MKTINIELDDKSAEWLQAWARSCHTSASCLLGELLAQKMQAEKTYLSAKQGYLSVMPLSLAQNAYPSRNASHER